MKESNTLAGYVTRNLQIRDILPNIEGQYMKESNTLADNATRNLQRRDILLNTEGQYMKESNTLADGEIRILNAYIYGTLQYKTEILSDFFLKTAGNMSSPFLNQYTKSSEILDLCNSYLNNS